MKLIHAVIIILFYKVCFSQVVLPPVDAALKTGTTRTASMGGVYIANSFGAGSLFGNPAGICFADTVELTIESIMPIIYRSHSENSFYSRYNHTEKIKWSNQINPTFRKVGAAFPIIKSNSLLRLYSAFGYWKMYDWKKNIGFYHNYNYNSEKNSSEIEEKVDGFLNYLSFCFAGLYNNRFSLALAIDVPVQKKYSFTRKETWESNNNDYYNRIIKQFANYDIFASKIIRIGGLLKIKSKFIIGFTFVKNHRFSFDNGISRVETVTEKARYHHTYDLESSRWEIPSKIDFGISYKFKPNLLLTVEVENRPWQKITANNLPISGVKNGNDYKIGAEYGNRFQIRTGISLNCLPLLDSNDNSVLMNSVTSGFGLKTKHFIFDLGIEYQFSTFKIEKYGKDYDYCIKNLLLYTTMKIK